MHRARRAVLCDGNRAREGGVGELDELQEHRVQSRKSRIGDALVTRFRVGSASQAVKGPLPTYASYDARATLDADASSRFVGVVTTAQRRLEASLRAARERGRVCRGFKCS